MGTVGQDFLRDLALLANLAHAGTDSLQGGVVLLLTLRRHDEDVAGPVVGWSTSYMTSILFTRSERPQGSPPRISGLTMPLHLPVITYVQRRASPTVAPDSLPALPEQNGRSHWPGPFDERVVHLSFLQSRLEQERVPVASRACRGVHRRACHWDFRLRSGSALVEGERVEAPPPRSRSVTHDLSWICRAAHHLYQAPHVRSPRTANDLR